MHYSRNFAVLANILPLRVTVFSEFQLGDGFDCLPYPNIKLNPESSEGDFSCNFSMSHDFEEGIIEATVKHFGHFL